MKTIWPNIKFTSSYLIVSLGFVLTGYFKNLIFFTLLILVHECGHYLVGKSFGYKLIRIYIYPFGGLTKFENFVNQELKEEFLVSIAGLLFQITFYYILLFIYKQGILLSYYDLLLIKKYHYSMLLFNALPIIPLDGAKILACFFYKIFNFHIANKMLIASSFIILLCLFVIVFPYLDYNYLIIGLILLTDIFKYIKDLKYFCYKFLLERYLYQFKFKKLKTIKNSNEMYRDRRHLIYTNEKYVTEKQFLQKMFDL